MTGNVCLQFSVGKRPDLLQIVVRLISDICFRYGIGSYARYVSRGQKGYTPLASELLIERKLSLSLNVFS